MKYINNSEYKDIDRPSALEIYDREIRKIRLLTDSKEKELARRNMQGNQKAKQHLIEANLRLVEKIAWGYRKKLKLKLEEFEDIIQEGNLGLMHAIDKLDVNKGVKLSTYSSFWIRNAIKRALYKPGLIKEGIYIPHRWMELREKANQLRVLFEKDHNREPTRDELIKYVCNTTGKSKKTVELVIDFHSECLSLDAPDKESVSLLDIIDSSEYTPERILVKIDDYEKFKRLDKYLEALGPKEEDVIRLRYGILNDRVRKQYGVTDQQIENLRQPKSKQLSLLDVGFFTGDCSEGVRQIENKTLIKLKWKLERDPIFGSFLADWRSKPIDLDITDSVYKISKNSIALQKKRGQKTSLSLLDHMRKTDIKEYLKYLSEQQREIIQLFYGIEDKELRKELGFKLYGRISHEDLASRMGKSYAAISVAKSMAEKRIMYIDINGKPPPVGRPKGNIEVIREQRLGNRELAVKALPNINNPIDRNIINLLYRLDDGLLDIDYSFDGKSPTYNEISDLLNIPKSHIAYRHKRGMQELKHYMDLFEQMKV